MTDIRKLTGIHTVATEMAKIASASGLNVPEEHVIDITIEADGMLPDSIVDTLEDPETTQKIIEAVTEAAGKLKEPDNNVKTGGLSMSRRILDLVDEINVNSDKIASTHGPMGAAAYRMEQVAEQPLDVLATVVEKIAGLQDIVVKLANAVEAVTGNVDAKTAITDTDGNAVIQDSEGQGNDQVDLLVGNQKDHGKSAMTGDPTGKLSNPLNPANAAVGGVKANGTEKIADVIANSSKVNSKVQDILNRVKKEKK